MNFIQVEIVFFKYHTHQWKISERNTDSSLQINFFIRLQLIPPLQRCQKRAASPEVYVFCEGTRVPRLSEPLQITMCLKQTLRCPIVLCFLQDERNRVQASLKLLK